MRRFLLRLSLFLLPIALLAIGAEAYVRQIPNSYRIKQQLLDRVADSVETVILGNSHAYSGIRPELLPGVVANLANVSQTLDVDLALLERCIERCPQLKQVILVVDNSNLFDSPMEETGEWFRITYYTLYMQRLGGHNPYLSRYGLELLHFQSFCGKIKKWHQLQRPDCTPLGWDTNNSWAAKDQANWNQSSVDRKLSRHTCQDWEQARRNTAAAVKMARLCHQHHIRLTLLCTPVYKSYADGIPPRQQHWIEETHRACTEFAGVQSLDLSRDSTYSDDEYFDPDHLTHEGAEHLTLTLRQQLFDSPSDAE